MRRKWMGLTLALALALTIVGCGAASEPAATADSAGNAASASEAKAEDQSEEKEAAQNDVANETSDASEEATADEGLQIVELTPETDFVSEGDYEISGLFSDILSDRSVREGWYYYYSEGTEPKVPWEKWKCADGMYTSCELLFNLTGLNDAADKSSSERFSGVIVFNAPADFSPEQELDEAYVTQLLEMAQADSSIEVYPLTTMQDNPDQVDLDGIQARSIDATILENGQTAKQSLVADVSEAFYRSWENKEAKESMWAFFGYDDNYLFAVDLRKYMEEAN